MSRAPKQVGKVLSVVLLGPFDLVVSLLEQVAAEA